VAGILDEGQYIKNPSSQTAQVARALRGEHRLVYPHTIENRLLDLWSLMSFSMPGVLGSRAQFAACMMPKAIPSPGVAWPLGTALCPAPHKRASAKDLPDRIEEDLFCEIEGEQQACIAPELKRAQQLLLHIKTQKNCSSSFIS